MGIEAGKLQKDGNYTEGTLFKMVMKRLQELRSLRKYKPHKKTSHKPSKAAVLEPMTLEEVLKLEGKK